MFASIQDVELRKYTGLYQTGLTLRVEERPECIELVRCVNPASPDTPVVFGSAVNFVMTAAGAKITRIEDLTPGATKYEFTFRITYGDA